MQARGQRLTLSLVALAMVGLGRLPPKNLFPNHGRAYSAPSCTDRSRMSDECEPDLSRDGSGNVHDDDAAAAERRIASAAKATYLAN